MSNHARHHRHRRTRQTKIRGLAWMDLPDAMRLLDDCDCPAVIITSSSTAGPVVVQHMHRHACPALKRWTT